MLQIIQELTDKEMKVYSMFDESIKPSSNIMIAYSGGKDSTALALLFYRWVKMRKISGLKVTLLHNDTLSEINPMEEWARKFMIKFKSQMKKLGNTVKIKIATPPAIDTFYWRAIIRGYPAPSFNFRWCVKLLKVRPTGAMIANANEDGAIVFTGLRENESNARAMSMKKRYGGCPLGPSKCLAYYFLVKNDKESVKAAPLRDWSNADVWEFMRNAKDFDISDLLFLYGCDEARYGCWHCTLAKVQWGFQALPKQYLYFDALRVLYRKISDLPEMRIKKKTGYSKLGPLNATARSMFLHLLRIAEDRSGIKLYGMDEAKADGYTIRELFYETDARKAMSIILNEDSKIDHKRVVPMSKIRNLHMHKTIIRRAIPKIKRQSENHKSRVLAMNRGLDPVDELLVELESRLK